MRDYLIVTYKSTSTSRLYYFKNFKLADFYFVSFYNFNRNKLNSFFIQGLSYGIVGGLGYVKAEGSLLYLCRRSLCLHVSSECSSGLFMGESIKFESEFFFYTAFALLCHNPLIHYSNSYKQKQTYVYMDKKNNVWSQCGEQKSSLWNGTRKMNTCKMRARERRLQ